MTKVAISGIPAYWVRAITAKTGLQGEPCYREVLPVVSTTEDVLYEMSRIQNTGNYLIGEGLRRAITSREFVNFPLPRLVGSEGEAVIKHINKNFDVFAFATANFFHIAFDPRPVVELFSRIDIPIVMMSAGIQRASDFGATYPPGFEPFLKLLRERNIKVFTRGLPTQQFLHRHGVTSAEPIGCPSLFSFPNGFRTSLEKLKHVAAQPNLDILHSGYLGSVKDTIVDIRALGGAPARTAYVAQDELSLFNYKIEAVKNTRVYDDTTGRLLVSPTFPGREELSKTLDHYVFFNTDQWRAVAGTYHLAFARRFHGGVIAAQAGVPALWISVDDRTREMLSFAKLPYLDSSEWNPSNKLIRFKKFIEEYDPAGALKDYEQAYRRFRDALRSVNLAD